MKNAKEFLIEKAQKERDKADQCRAQAKISMEDLTDCNKSAEEHDALADEFDKAAALLPD